MILQKKEMSIIWLSVLFLCSSYVAANCNPGFNSPGWILPQNDIYVLEGEPVEMFCGLNTTHELGMGHSVDDLIFTIEGQDNSAVTETFNSSVLRLYIEKSKVSHLKYYMVNCKLGDLGICSRHIYVGYMPTEVEDFQCISPNWESLECTWQIHPNPVSTTYKLSYASSITTRRVIKQTCPTSKNGASTCVLTSRTVPPYMPTHTTYNFTMSISNALADMTQYLGIVDNFAVVVPNPMENLVASSVDPYSVQVGWKIPSALNFFPPGLRYRVIYKIDSSWSDNVLHEIDTSSLDPKGKEVNMTFPVPYPNANYTISVLARSSSANGSLSRFWSKPVNVSVTSASDRPCAAPKAALGSFEIFNTRLELRMVTLYWSPLEPQCRNSPKATYVVDLLDLHGTVLETHAPLPITANNARFNNLNRNQHFRFRIRSKSPEGFSDTDTEIFLPMADAMPGVPLNVGKVVYDETLYEVQWNAPPAIRANSLTSFTQDYVRHPEISSYTVFWCHSVRDNPVSCEGKVDWLVVPATQTAVNITVPDAERNYQFAVEANQGQYASGLVWAGCVINANGNGSQVKQLSVVSRTNTSIELQWFLPCSQQNGIIVGFNVYYCSVNGDGADYPEEPPCAGKEVRMSVGAGDSHLLIEELEPFTWYKLVVSTQSRFGEGQSSKYQMSQTSEGVPSPPLDLHVSDVTNHSISIGWKKPIWPRGNALVYSIFVNGRQQNKITTDQTTIILSDGIESFSQYVVSVQACQDPKAQLSFCSDLSESVSVRTKIGVPGVPQMPKIKPANSNNPSEVAITWSSPNHRAGLVDIYIIDIQYLGGEINKTYNSTDAKMMVTFTPDLCPSGEEMKVRIQAANRDENGQLLLSEWSDYENCPCPSSGLELWNIILIALSVVFFIGVVVSFVFYRRCQIQKKAERISVILPWEHGIGRPAGGQETPPTDLKLAKESMADIGVGYLNSGNANLIGNHYGRLESKLSGGTIITNLTNARVLDNKDSESISERQSHSSGCGSAQDSLSWHHTSRSEISNSDSGAELEPPSSPHPDCNTFDDAPLDSLQMWREGAVDQLMKPVMEPIGSGKVQMEGPTFYPQFVVAPVTIGGVEPVEPTPVAQSYVRFGLAPAASQTQGQPVAKSVGYVTLGEAPIADSPNSSPNLSVGSNDSLLYKKDRASLNYVGNKRNSGGYVTASLAAPDADVSEIRPSATQGYVTLKSSDLNSAPAATTATPVQSTYGSMTMMSNPSSNYKAPPRGYVTLGSLTQPNQQQTSPTDAASSHPVCNAHYVTLGVEPAAGDAASQVSFI